MVLNDGCAMDCSTWIGTYCDRGTGKCENCVDICVPSRGTMSECLENITCKDFWPVSTTDHFTQPSVSTVPYSSAPDVSVEKVAAIVSVAIAIVIILVLIFTCLWRNGKLKRFFNCCRLFTLKPPVQLSTQEQQREEREMLNSVAVEKNAGTTSAPEVNNYVPTM